MEIISVENAAQLMVEGTIKQVYPIKDYKNGFKKKVFTVMSNRRTFAFELHAHKDADNLGLTDSFREKQHVRVYFSIQCSQSPRRDEDWFTNMVVWKIEAA